MAADHKVQYMESEFVTHSGYLYDGADHRNADVWYQESGGEWWAWQDGPRPIRWSDFALYHYRW